MGQWEGRPPGQRGWPGRWPGVSCLPERVSCERSHLPGDVAPGGGAACCARFADWELRLSALKVCPLLWSWSVAGLEPV